MGAADDLPDGRLLRLFETLLATRSVSAAAEKLGVSQPAASAWLAQLRVYFDDPLFVREANGMEPTARALELEPMVRRALDALRRLGRTPLEFDAAASERVFRLHLTDASHVTLLPALIGRISAAAPDVELRALSIDEHTEARLRSGASDCAVGDVPHLSRTCRTRQLFLQDWICVVGPDHPFPDVPTLDEYRAATHVRVAHGSGSARLDHALASLGVERRVRLTVPGVLGLPAVLRTSRLVATLPRQVGTHQARTFGLRILTCPVPAAPYPIGLYWHPRADFDPAHAWLRGLVVEVFGADPDAVPDAVPGWTPATG